MTGFGSSASNRRALERSGTSRPLLDTCDMHIGKHVEVYSETTGMWMDGLVANIPQSGVVAVQFRLPSDQLGEKHLRWPQSKSLRQNASGGKSSNESPEFDPAGVLRAPPDVLERNKALTQALDNVQQHRLNKQASYSLLNRAARAGDGQHVRMRGGKVLENADPRAGEVEIPHDVADSMLAAAKGPRCIGGTQTVEHGHRILRRPDDSDSEEELANSNGTTIYSKECRRYWS
eukprot:gnl/TRDRNA2_/TRDRNA2_37964_c1_seq1.p1 gnl/TRDRNA2_/TRDRNA2_37964_c1~~gnl/TRDRNA2_/TRDRNA2_37964_c1_seq1.p1  ORF type:complete len:233 (-),score=31.42 gnl/TRDRNA2_/TRDRNA2_37964_c1_seq1:127-825(-)